MPFSAGLCNHSRTGCGAWWNRLKAMQSVTVMDWLHRTDDILAHTARGDVLTITLDGAPVATIGPPPRRPVPVEQLISRRSSLPVVDTASLRNDLDDVLDTTV